TEAAGVVLAGPLGHATPEGSAGADGSAEPHDPGVNRGGGKGSREQARGAIADESSGRRPAYGASFRADHRDTTALSLRQADGELPGTYPLSGFQRRSAALGTPQQAR